MGSIGRNTDYLNTDPYQSGTPFAAGMSTGLVEPAHVSDQVIAQADTNTMGQWPCPEPAKHVDGGVGRGWRDRHRQAVPEAADVIG